MCVCVFVTGERPGGWADRAETWWAVGGGAAPPGMSSTQWAGWAQWVKHICRLLRSLSDLRTNLVKLISMEARGLTKVASVCRPKFVSSLSQFKGKHFIRREAKNQLTLPLKTLSTPYTPHARTSHFYSMTPIPRDTYIFFRTVQCTLLIGHH